METAYIVFRQTVVMFLYMFAGYLMFRFEKLSKEGGKDIANLLVWQYFSQALGTGFLKLYRRLSTV